MKIQRYTIVKHIFLIANKVKYLPELTVAMTDKTVMKVMIQFISVKAPMFLFTNI